MTEENKNLLNDIASKGMTAMGKVLIAKLSMYPYFAEQKAESDKIKIQGMIDNSELAARAGYRILWQQGNIESIAKIAEEQLQDENIDKADNILDDWAAHFFEKAKNISDKDMQRLWANILAGEVKKQGSFSKKTVKLVGEMDKKDAQMFTTFCAFVWNIGGESQPLIYDDKYVFDKTINTFDMLTHLEFMGLVSNQHLNSYIITFSNRYVQCDYHGISVFLAIPFDEEEKFTMSTGMTMLTKAGEELFPICGAKKNDEFFEHVINQWEELEYNPSFTSHTEWG